MEVDFKEKAKLQVEAYEHKQGTTLLDEMAKEIEQIIENCQVYAPHYFTNEHKEKIIPALISEYQNLLKREDILESLKESILEGNFAEEFKSVMLCNSEKSFCKGVAENFFEIWGKGNFHKGTEKFLQTMFCNKKNYEYFYINSKEFASLSSSMSEENKKAFDKARNHWFNGYLKFQYVYLIIAMFPIALPYLLLKKLTKRLAGIPNSREKILKDPYTTEMFVILEKAGYWK